jgi:hypothetical protein
LKIHSSVGLFPEFGTELVEYYKSAIVTILWLVFHYIWMGSSMLKSALKTRCKPLYTHSNGSLHQKITITTQT